MKEGSKEHWTWRKGRKSIRRGRCARTTFGGAAQAFGDAYKGDFAAGGCDGAVVQQQILTA